MKQATNRGGYMQERIERRGTGALGSHVVVHASCDSTQLEAKIAANQGAPHGTLILAHHQRQGIARHGRTWYSDQEGLYFSIVLRPTGLAFAHLARFPLLAGVGLWEGLQSLGAPALIKWPNDILVAHPVPGPLGSFRKIAGCLVQPLLTGQRLDAVVLGIGVNVRTPEGGFPHEIKDIAGSLADVGVQVTKEKALGKILDGLEFWFKDAQNDEHFYRALDRVRASSATLGRAVEVSLAGQHEKGVAEGLDCDGALLLRKADGDLVRIVSGDVRP